MVSQEVLWDMGVLGQTLLIAPIFLYLPPSWIQSSPIPCTYRLKKKKQLIIGMVELEKDGKREIFHLLLYFPKWP